jgi:transcription-repair coupling factor (superfamily II helicase)
VGGVHGGAVGLLCAAAAAHARATLVVVPDARQADGVILDVAAFLGRTPFAFPVWPHEPGQGPPDADTLAARVAALTALAEVRAGVSGARPVIVASLPALAQDVRPPRSSRRRRSGWRSGDHPRPRCSSTWPSGFVRVGAVESPGEFAGRGGVVDVWPFGAGFPLRLDFFGDTIESIREVDPSSQRSGASRRSLGLLALAPERVRDPASGGGPCFVLEHLPKDALVVLVEPATLSARTALLKGEGDAAGRVRLRRLDQALSSSRRLELAALRLALRATSTSSGHPRRHPGIAGRVERAAAARRARGPKPTAVPVVEAFHRLRTRADRIVVFRRAPGGKRLPAPPDVPFEFAQGSLALVPLRPTHRLARLRRPADLTLRERRPPPRCRPRPIQDFLELEPGEPWSTCTRHRRVPRARAARGRRQAMKLEFAEGTTLFVPVARIDLVQRYIGTGRRPRLSKVGGSEWGARKAKVEAAVEDLAEELIEVQAMRTARRGPPYAPHPQWQAEFEGAFPWKDTPDQTTATISIKADLASDRPMDRLLCGDVGYGKTEIALRAAFLVAAAGRQVAVLVPTTVLAEQHLRTFRARLAPYPLTVRAISRFRTPAEAREIVAGLADGSVDVVVGTHRLLADVVFGPWPRRRRRGAALRREAQGG